MMNSDCVCTACWVFWLVCSALKFLIQTFVLYSLKHLHIIVLSLSIFKPSFLLLCVSIYSQIHSSPDAASFLLFLTCSLVLFSHTLIAFIRHSLLLPLTQSILLPESWRHLCSHTFMLSLCLTHIPLNLQSLFLLHLFPTCLPIPESKLKALTPCVPNQKTSVMVTHTSGNGTAVGQLKFDIISWQSLVVIIQHWRLKRHFLTFVSSVQGAIFLFFAGRTEEIKGNIDEVCFTNCVC